VQEEIAVGKPRRPRRFQSRMREKTIGYRIVAAARLFRRPIFGRNHRHRREMLYSVLPHPVPLPLGEGGGCAEAYAYVAALPCLRLGVRQSSGALGGAVAFQSGTGVPHSKTFGAIARQFEKLRRDWPDAQTFAALCRDAATLNGHRSAMSLPAAQQHTRMSQPYRDPRLLFVLRETMSLPKMGEQENC
jgi:hypothetical protein